MVAPIPEQVVLKSLFDEFCANEYPGEKVDDVFEIYGSSQILKPREISPDELSAGIVDGEKDGGIDSFFVFLNGALLSPDDPVLTPGDPSVKKIGHRPLVEVFLIQSRNTDKWSESVWGNLLSSLDVLLDLSTQDSEMEEFYNVAVIESTGILRRAVTSLAGKFPRIKFNLFYVTRAPEENISATLKMRAAQVEQRVESKLTTGSKVSATHVGAQGLYKIAGEDFGQPAKLEFRNLIREKSSYLGVVTLRSYLDFVRSDQGKLRDELFDSNVRDFEGDNSVNEAIGSTLATDDDAEFWWLNNGVTVLGTEVDGPQNTLTVSQPLIVNGLQTTHVLDEAERSGTLNPSRLEDGIVVRVIESDDEDTRDKVIAGTNRQTRVPTVSLYATQPLQRDIERYLLAHNWYYERRKNRYKNQGKPAKRRITMNLLAQAMITLMLGQPDTARARPSTALGRVAGYASVFPEDLNVKAYLTAVEIIKAVDDFLRTDAAKELLDEYSNTRFYVAVGYEILALGIKNPKQIHFKENYHRLTAPLDMAVAGKALTILALTADSYQKKFSKLSRDSIFKSVEFRDLYFDALVE
ncbi:hypothetical protein Skr01_35840 [Sphaerisporangium krabiense]|nr:hypothetical protein Skr01_35840 [Sphaerisporangium krabiense]